MPLSFFPLSFLLVEQREASAARAQVETLTTKLLETKIDLAKAKGDADEAGPLAARGAAPTSPSRGWGIGGLFGRGATPTAAAAAPPAAAALVAPATPPRPAATSATDGLLGATAEAAAEGDLLGADAAPPTADLLGVTAEAPVVAAEEDTEVSGGAAAVAAAAVSATPAAPSTTPGGAPLEDDDPTWPRNSKILSAVYERFNADKLESAGEIAKKFKGRTGDLVAGLRTKYGADEVNAILKTLTFEPLPNAGAAAAAATTPNAAAKWGGWLKEKFAASPAVEAAAAAADGGGATGESAASTPSSAAPAVAAAAARLGGWFRGGGTPQPAAASPAAAAAASPAARGAAPRPLISVVFGPGPLGVALGKIDEDGTGCQVLDLTKGATGAQKYNAYVTKTANAGDVLLRPGRKLVSVNDTDVAALHFKEAIVVIKAQARPMTLHFA